MLMEPALSSPLDANARVLANIMSAQAEMAAALPDSDAVMRLVVRHSMHLTGATGASICFRDGEEVYFPVNEGFTAGYERTRFPITSTLSGHCLLTGEMYHVQDLLSLPSAASHVARDAGIRSFLSVPLRHDNQVVAALSVAAPRPLAFSEREILVLHLLVGLAGSAMAHAQAYDDLRVAMEDAKHARAESAEFAGMIAHELGSPIAAIRQACELLSLDSLSPRQERARTLIETESKALRLLAGDLRATSSLERDSFDIHPRGVSLNAMLLEAGNFAQSLPGEHQVIVEPGPDQEIRLDPGRIAQVLRNLVTNAAKYTLPASPIVIRARRDEDRIWIDVVDRGPGIDPKDVSLIFSKFGRVRTSSDSQVPGLGLGLYLSKRIVEAHGGELIVKSTPGSGATFTFSVPVVT